MMRRAARAIENHAFAFLIAHPILLFLGFLALGEDMAGALLAEVGALLFSTALYLLPIKRRALFCLLPAAALCVFLFLLPLPLVRRFLLLPFILLFFLCAVGTCSRLAAQSGRGMLAAGWGVYLLAVILMRFDVYPHALLTALTAGAALLIPIGLGISSRCAMNDMLAVHSGISTAGRITLLNRALSYIFSFIILLFSAIEGVKNAGASILNALKQAIAALINWFMRLLSLLPYETAGPGEGGGGMDLSGLAEQSAPNPFLALLEQALRILVLAALAAGAAALLFIIGRKLMRLIKKYWLRLRERLFAADGDYEDERLRLSRRRDEREKARKASFRRPASRIDWASLNARERVLWIGGLMIKRHSPRPSDTPRDILEKENAPLVYAYERARYSDLPLSRGQEAEAEKAYEALRKR